MYDRILIAVDGSETATRAAVRGLDLAARFEATVDGLYVVDHVRSGWRGRAPRRNGPGRAAYRHSRRSKRARPNAGSR